MENIDGRDFKFLIGKSIVNVRKYTDHDSLSCVDAYELTCDDGTKITIKCNAGCGGCGNGWSYIDLLPLGKNKNVITNVKCEYDNEHTEDYRFTLFIYYENEQINIDGDDGYGNGYYGGGFYVDIINIEE